MGLGLGQERSVSSTCEPSSGRTIDGCKQIRQKSAALKDPRQHQRQHPHHNGLLTGVLVRLRLQVVVQAQV